MMHPAVSKYQLSEVARSPELFYLKEGTIAAINGLGRLLVSRLRKSSSVKLSLLRFKFSEDHFHSRFSLTLDSQAIVAPIVIDSPSATSAYFSEYIQLICYFTTDQRFL